MQDKGIELKSLNENIDTRTATGKLLFHIVAAFAQFERDNMIENTKAGLEAVRTRGKSGIVYRLLPARKRQPCPHQPAQALTTIRLTV